MIPGGMFSAGGGMSSSSSSSAASGDATGTSGTGTKNVIFGGGNPNTVGGVLSNPLVILGLVAVVYFLAQR